MRPSTKSILIIVAAIGLASPALGDLPRSWSFADETDTRIESLGDTTGFLGKDLDLRDVDLDGDLDLVVVLGSIDGDAYPNKLYLNDLGVFQDVSGSPIIPDFAQGDVSMNVFIRDYSGDGRPDIYVVNDSSKAAGFAATDKLYVAHWVDGTLSHFVDEATTRLPNGGLFSSGAIRGATSFDMDGDGTVDVYRGTYAQDLGLFGDGTGAMVDLTATNVPDNGDWTTDVSHADMNGDGKLDLIVTIDFPSSFIYYNDNLEQGTGPGDFRYPGSEQPLTTAHMTPGDFDNDGDQDLHVAGGTDVVLRNDGNDGNNQAILVPVEPFTGDDPSGSAHVADFNDDGRPDLFYSTGVLYRNTTVNGGISFIEWTPPAARGLSGIPVAADTNGDGDVDVIIGRLDGEALLENVRANERSEASLGGALPHFLDQEPMAIFGDAITAPDSYTTTFNGAGGVITVVLNGPDDYLLEVINVNGIVEASSDRGGLGVEEVLQATLGNGAHTIRVTVLERDCKAADFDGDCGVGFDDLLHLLANWGCRGCPSDLDGGGTGLSDLVILLSEWGEQPGDYLLEVLGRCISSNC